MLDLNPYQYDTVEYYKHEADCAKRNLNFVISGAGQQIKNCNLDEEQDIVLSACEAVVSANEQYKSALKRYTDKLAKESA